MPKVVDNYVLERKIGSGQYGDVFKGYNKINKQDVAIKAIKRESLKGKFSQLLQNEIKVLRTCDNPNIIKLYDLKKTANNFYLILQYCNQGDLMVYLKQKKHLPEDEAVDILVQILTAFRTLVKNKIMHRDFKLANILKHDGEIKIADFGFAKLLTKEDYATTMLGSPLNMAPEVLGGNDYNNKADIWSIGTVFFQLLFGKPPYTAGNMVDLIANIKNKPLVIPKQVNNISPVVEDVIRKMITVDPKKRIEWQDLFNHPINHFLQDKIGKELEETLHQNQDIALNMSKFYMKNNMVIDHPHEISQKQAINDYALDVVKGNAKAEFKGTLIKRTNARKEDMPQKQAQVKTIPGDTDKGDDKIDDKMTEREVEIRIFKENSVRILHHRNVYVFIAMTAQEAITMTEFKLSQVVGYMLLKKLMGMVEWMKTSLSSKKPFPGTQKWQAYVHQKDHENIKLYVEKEYQIFGGLYSKVEKQLKENIKKYDHELQEAIMSGSNHVDQKLLGRLIRDYLKDAMGFLLGQMNKQKNIQNFRREWAHIDRMLDCLQLDTIFQYERNGVVFNFKEYYANHDGLTNEQLLKKVEEKYKRLK